MPQKLTALTSSGKEKTIYWDKKEDPSQDDIDSLPDYVESKPSISQRFIKGITDPATSLYERVKSTGVNAAKHLKEGNYPAAFGDVVAPIMHPFEGIMGAASKEVPRITNPGTQLAEQAGIPLSLMKESYAKGDYSRLTGQSLSSLALLALSAKGQLPKGSKEVGIPKIDLKEMPLTEHGPYPLRDTSTPIGPVEKTSFEGLSSNIPPKSSKYWTDYKVDPTEPTQPKIDFGDEVTQGQLNLQDYPAQHPLTPDRYKNPTVIGPKQPEVTPQPLQPRIAGPDRPTWSKFAEQRNLPLDYDVVGRAETISIPEIQQAAKQVVEKEATSIKPPNNLFEVNKDKNRIYEDNLKSSKQVLIHDSPAGKAIMDLLDEARTRHHTYYGHAAASLKDVWNPLNKSQQVEAQNLIDRGGSSPDPMVQNAVDTFKGVSNQAADMATNSGMKLDIGNGEKIPFTGREDYWAHIYDPKMFSDKPALLTQLIKNGMSPLSAKKAIESMSRNGERLIDPEHARQSNLEGYRTDLGSQLHHYDDMSRRIATSEVLGPEDIADPESPISKLIAQTRNPEQVTKIVAQQLGRDNRPMSHEIEFINKLKTASTAYYLSKFALTNTSQIAMTPLVANLNTTARALGKFLLNPKQVTRNAERTGALQPVDHMIRTQGAAGILSKLFLMKQSEGFTRTISSLAGDLYVQDLFDKLKKNPTNPRLRADIEKLTLDNADSILAQGQLSTKQREYASNRVSELSQGLAEPIDLPYNWNRSPYVDLITLYKKFAFTQSKLAKDAIKSNPAKNIALFLALSQLRGEATGDAKALIMGQDPSKRGDIVGSPSKIVNRLVMNQVDSQFLGLIADAIISSGSKTRGIKDFLSGPIINLADTTARNVITDARNYKKVVKDPTKSKTIQQFMPRRLSNAMK